MAWLLYTYLAPPKKSQPGVLEWWRSWVSDLMKDRDCFTAESTEDALFDVLRRLYDKPKLIVDEALMMMNNGIAEEEETHRMMNAAYSLPKTGTTAVLFSALTRGSLKEKSTPDSEVLIAPTTLHVLPDDSVRFLIECMLINHPDKAAQLTSSALLNVDGG